MQIGGEEQRHATAVALVINPDVWFSPEMFGEPLTQRTPRVSRSPMRSRRRSVNFRGIPLVVGEADPEDGSRFTAVLQTPAENSLVYEHLSCRSDVPDVERRAPGGDRPDRRAIVTPCGTRRSGCRRTTRRAPRTGEQADPRDEADARAPDEYRRDTRDPGDDQEARCRRRRRRPTAWSPRRRPGTVGCPRRSRVFQPSQPAQNAPIAVGIEDQRADADVEQDHHRDRRHHERERRSDSRCW